MNAPATDFSAGPAETDKTGETDAVGNGDFLRAVFGNAVDDTQPVVVSFAGNPATAAKSAWFGRPWLDDDTKLPGDANNYFSLAVFRPDEAGQYRRRKAQFSALHAVMLDDLGRKVPMERLTLPPSWLLETSPGNHQAGYLLREPLIDGLLADRLMNAIVAAGLCDPGANGPRARLARLPVSVNGKHKSPFPCRMMTWAPELRYSVEELIAGLELEIAQTARPKRQTARPSQARPDDGDPVWLARPDENAVLAGLRNRGLYKSPLGEGKHDITCPWVEEHTGEVDGGTAYFEPDDNWPIGGFKCLHGHCAERHVRDLLAFLNIEINGARMKPMILAQLRGLEAVRKAIAGAAPPDERAEQRTSNPTGCATTEGAPAPQIIVRAGELPRIVADAITALRSAGVPIYDRGGALYRPVRIEAQSTSDGVWRSAGALVLRAVDATWLRVKLADAAQWQKWDTRDKKMRPADPPRDIGEIVATQSDRGSWDSLRGVVLSACISKIRGHTFLDRQNLSSSSSGEQDGRILPRL